MLIYHADNGQSFVKTFTMVDSSWDSSTDQDIHERPADDRTTMSESTIGLGVHVKRYVNGHE